MPIEEKGFKEEWRNMCLSKEELSKMSVQELVAHRAAFLEKAVGLSQEENKEAGDYIASVDLCRGSFPPLPKPLTQAINAVSHAETEEETFSKLKSLKLAAKNLLSKALRGGNKILEYIGKALLIIANLCLHLIKIVFNFFKKVVLEFGHFIPNCKKIGFIPALNGLFVGLQWAATAAIFQEGKRFKESSEKIMEGDGLRHAGSVFLDENIKNFEKDWEAINELLKEWKKPGSSQKERALTSGDEALEEDDVNLDYVPPWIVEGFRRWENFGDDVASAPLPRSRKS